MTAIPDFEEHGFDFPAHGTTHAVTWFGQGPPVLVMHELPGLSEATLEFGQRLAGEGFTVYLPLLFGRKGEYAAMANRRALCISAEWAKLAAGVSAPIVDWLRALANDISTRHGGGSVGAIGMCVTGSFVIPLILEPCVTAPVAAQPAVPYSIPYRLFGTGRGDWMHQLNISDSDLTAAADRSRREGIELMAARFDSDRICPKARLDRLETAFGNRLLRHELPTGSKLRALFDPPHSSLVEEFEKEPDRPDEPTRELFAKLVQFLRTRLTA